MAQEKNNREQALEHLTKALECMVGVLRENDELPQTSVVRDSKGDDYLIADECMFDSNLFDNTLAEFKEWIENYDN